MEARALARKRDEQRRLFSGRSEGKSERGYASRFVHNVWLSGQTVGRERVQRFFRGACGCASLFCRFEIGVLSSEVFIVPKLPLLYSWVTVVLMGWKKCRDIV